MGTYKRGVKMDKSIDFRTYTKKRLIKLNRKLYHDTKRLIRQKIELKEQVEKMKNYLNCENFGTEKCGKSADGCVCKNWELIK
jgi:hypothetical protein